MWYIIKKDKRKACLFEDGTLFLLGLLSAFSFPAMWLLTFISLISQHLKSAKLYKENKILAGQSSIAEFIKLTENNFWVYLFFTLVLFVLSLIRGFASQSDIMFILLTSFLPFFSFLVSNLVLIKLTSKRGPKLFSLVVFLGFVIGAALVTFTWFSNHMNFGY